MNCSLTLCSQMREIAEIELAIQGGTEKIETLGTYQTERSLLYNIDLGLV